MYQILKSVEYMHRDHIVHRDIKGANILISEDGVAKMADFGLANRLIPQEGKHYTTKVVTLWYRAPELLLGIQQYDERMDMWSVGCVFAEMFMNKVLFQGSPEAD
jgi:serine/threonine protein kinase